MLEMQCICTSTCGVTPTYAQQPGMHHGGRECKLHMSTSGHNKNGIAHQGSNLVCIKGVAPPGMEGVTPRTAVRPRQGNRCLTGRQHSVTECCLPVLLTLGARAEYWPNVHLKSTPPATQVSGGTPSACEGNTTNFQGTPQTQTKQPGLPTVICPLGAALMRIPTHPSSVPAGSRCRNH